MKRGGATRRGRRRRRAGVDGGYTVVELLLVVGVVAILAMMATYGVRRHLALAKSAEAVHTVGVIGRAAVAASERMATEGNTTAAVAVTTGQGKKGKGATVTHGDGQLPVCGDSTAVPSSFAAVQKRKYQPDSHSGKDYDAGTMSAGWRCLRFEVSSPQYYQYQYKVGGPPITVQLPHGGSPKGLSGGQQWSAYARGDLDGNGKIAWFIREGYERNGQMVTSSGIAMQDPEE